MDPAAPKTRFVATLALPSCAAVAPGHRQPAGPLRHEYPLLAEGRPPRYLHVGGGQYRRRQPGSGIRAKRGRGQLCRRPLRQIPVATSVSKGERVAPISGE